MCVLFSRIWVGTPFVVVCTRISQDEFALALLSLSCSPFVFSVVLGDMYKSCIRRKPPKTKNQLLLCAPFFLFRQAKEAEGADNAVMLLTHLTTFIMMLQDERVSADNSNE